MPIKKPTTKSVKFLRSGHYRIWSVDTPEVIPILEQMLPQPEDILNRATVLFGRGSSCDAFHVQLSGYDCFLKRYDCPSFGYSLRNVFRRSRARRVWSLSLRLLSLGVPVARPLILIEERKYRLLGPAYLVTEFYPGYQCLKDLWGTVCREEQNRLVQHAAKSLAQIHKHRYIHGDTNWDNVLFNSKGAGPEIKFVDLDCARMLMHFSYMRAERDLGHFVRDLRRDYNQGADRVDLFMSTWRNAIKNELSK
jgi:tRNA A-37 threonylcarbamoyl transferase component Bud32